MNTLYIYIYIYNIYIFWGERLNLNTFISSDIWVHHIFDFALKFPSIITKVVSNCLTSFRILSIFYWKLLNSVEVWLRDLYKTKIYIGFLLLMLIWVVNLTKKTGKYEMSICLTHKFPLNYKYTSPLFWVLLIIISLVTSD